MSKLCGQELVRSNEYDKENHTVDMAILVREMNRDNSRMPKPIAKSHTKYHLQMQEQVSSQGKQNLNRGNEIRDNECQRDE